MTDLTKTKYKDNPHIAYLGDSTYAEYSITQDDIFIFVESGSRPPHPPTVPNIWMSKKVFKKLQEFAGRYWK